MKQFLFLAIFCLTGLISYSQTKADTLLITEIVNLQLKLKDSYFKRDFALNKSSMPYDTAKSYYEFSEEYNLFLCGKFMDWSAFDVHSGFGSVETGSVTSEYACFISTPMFNADKTACRLLVSTHYSEWGGSTGYYYYKKRGKKWKLTDIRILSVS